MPKSPSGGSECRLCADRKQSSAGFRQLAAIGCPIVWDVAVIAVGVEIDSTGDAVAHGIAVAIFAVIPVIPEMPLANAGAATASTVMAAVAKSSVLIMAFSFCRIASSRASCDS